MNHPELSVVIVEPVDYSTLRRTLDCLRAQTVRDRIEVVVVTPSRAQFGADEHELAGEPVVRIVEVGPIQAWGHASAAGIRAARAPLVALGEDHAYPEPGWAAALLDANHKGDWAAIGSAIANANPATALSWANLLIAYGRWLAPTPAGPVNDVPGHNSAYRRELLLALGSRLEAQLERGGGLHQTLRAAGGRFYLAGDALVYHHNITALDASLLLRFHAGRLSAAERAAGWSLARRLLHTLAAPLIVVRRPAGVQAELRAAGYAALLPRIAPVLLLLLGVAALGELAGYAGGAGASLRRIIDFELYRERFLIKNDPVTLEPV